MRSVVVWVRPAARRTEVELSLELDALRIYSLRSQRLPSLGQSAANIFDATENLSAPTPPPDLLASISFANIIGCHRMKGRSSDDRSSYFTVYAYPPRGANDQIPKSNSSAQIDSVNDNDRGGRPNVSIANDAVNGNAYEKKTGRRERRCYTFQIHGRYIYEDNAAYAKNWMDAIRVKIMGQEPPHLRPAAVIPGDIQARQRRLYVLVNPHSGPGRALEIFQDRVMPVFAEANIACRLIVTERANHAHDLVRQLNISEWDGIVIVSGDGLVYEVINGLAMRPDRESALKIPVGAIPGGSGNALAVATCFRPSETIKGDFAVDAAVMVAKPIYRPMRLIRVEMHGHRIWSFISVGWGLLSDIDIESERFRRMLGSARFTAGACIRVLNLRKYRARISYVPVDDAPVLSSGLSSTTAVIAKKATHQGKNGVRQPQASAGDQTTSSAPQTVFARSFTSVDDDEKNGCPASVQDHRAKSLSLATLDRIGSIVTRESDGNADLVAATPSSEQPASFQVRFDHKPSPYPDRPTNAPAANTASRPSATVESNSLDDDRRGDIVPMPKIDEPVPPTWKVIEDELILFYAVYLDHIGAEVPYMPCSRLDDEIIYLTLIRASSVTRTQLIKFLFALETVEHLKMPFFEVIPAKAFRLDRLSSGSSDIVAVDGELIKDVQGPIQACVSKYSAVVMTAR